MGNCHAEEEKKKRRKEKDNNYSACVSFKPRALIMLV